jgi:farnesyl diphosphate synthase
LLLPELIEISRARTEFLLDNYITNSHDLWPLLKKSMRYSTLNGGKKLRPLFVYAANLALGGVLENADAPAAAVELIHGYSLVHDDLPLMDNSALRRGKPSCHAVYGETLALLAGDALQTLAFQVLADHHSKLSAEQRIKMISVLCNACGADGMAGGQALDMFGKIECISHLEQLYNLKTGALLVAAVRMGAVAANHYDITILDTYAANLGLAFQIRDDLLDFESDEETIGKPSGIDVINKKITYPNVLGIAKSRQKIEELTHAALTASYELGASGAILRELAEYLLQRKC